MCYVRTYGFFFFLLRLPVTESERKRSLNLCHRRVIVTVCFSHVSSVNHGKCGQQRAFNQVKSLFFRLSL